MGECGASIRITDNLISKKTIFCDGIGEIKMHRKVATFLCALVLVVLSAGIAFGGSQTDPEILDCADDIPYKFLDIDRAWFIEEDMDTLTVTLQLMDGPKDRLDFLSDVRSDNVTTYDFEVYFSFKDANYSVAARVQAAFHTTLLGDVFLLSAELREIAYIENGSIENETEIGSVNWDWDSENTAFTFTVDKVSIGAPEPKDVLTNTWAAVWDADKCPEDDARYLECAVDTANTYLDPGREYEFTGGFEYLYDVEIYATETEATAEPGQTVVYNFSVSASTTNPNGTEIWAVPIASINWSISSSLTKRNITGSANLTETLTVQVPENAKNGTTCKVTLRVLMTIPEGENETRLSSNTLTFSTTVIVPPTTPVQNKTLAQKLIDILTEPYILIILCAIIVVIIAAAVLAKKQEKR